jgi:Secretion system C-terminal sorting domain
MRTLITVLILAIAPFFGAAQRISPQVTNMAGFDLDLAASGQIITVSIGEPAIATFFNTDYILTQGFLQPEILPCKEFKLTYYPNPTPDDMIIEALGCDVEIEAMQLIDVWGRVITTMKPTKNNKVQLGDISPGAYFIKVFLTNTESETIKIAKVSN